MSPKSTAIFLFFFIFIGGGIYLCGWLVDGYYSLPNNVGSLVGLALGVSFGLFIGYQRALQNEAMEYIRLNTDIELDEILRALDNPEKEGTNGHNS